MQHNLGIIKVYGETPQTRLAPPSMLHIPYFPNRPAALHRHGLARDAREVDTPAVALEDPSKGGLRVQFKGNYFAEM